METFDLAVAGGGPAGAACAIASARNGMRVLLLERGRYPRHKVCGEFVSAESLALLRDLLGDTSLLRDAPQISRSRIHSSDAILESRIDPAAASITRYKLDAELWSAAQRAGCDCRHEVEVHSVDETGPFLFRTTAGEFQATLFANATGRWSRLSASPDGTRAFIGLKCHFAGECLPETVELFAFDGGYCGIQPIGPQELVAGAIVDASVATALEQVFAASPELWRRSRDWQPLFEPLATGALRFIAAQSVRDGVPQLGDAAGFIDPFLGDGISLALQSGKLFAGCVRQHGLTTAATHAYEKEYERRFAPLFRRAARLRRIWKAPQQLRSAALSTLNFLGMGNHLLRFTRPKVM